ncbi:hypothetical protein TNCV_2147251 [Trichonephila clavipes]|uniref:Uncharacterized protein n=1 Tax=Trichonephila clavipes TaxID=2585209 RepID=A0A8X6VIK1_TRICX|nr:hypothetical protein TNCV_2147251 [Trichonephila clavipes]
MATPGSSFTPTPLGHEDNLGVRSQVLKVSEALQEGPVGHMRVEYLSIRLSTLPFRLTAELLFLWLMCVRMFPLHAEGHPPGSGDTRFHTLPLFSALSHHRHPCSATNVINSGSFRLTPFQC